MIVFIHASLAMLLSPKLRDHFFLSPWEYTNWYSTFQGTQLYLGRKGWIIHEIKTGIFFFM